MDSVEAWDKKWLKSAHESRTTGQTIDLISSLTTDPRTMDEKASSLSDSIG